MRKLVYGINMSLDGCCDHTRFGGGSSGDDIHEYFTRLLEGSDLLLYGRKTYELMVPFWPEIAKAQSMDEASNRFATVFDSLNKIVVSNSMTEMADEHTTIMQGNLKEEVLRLKQQPGKDISTGGVTLPGHLLALGLIDEFHIVVHPVLVGEGRRLFAEVSMPENTGLKLIESRTLGGGCVVLHYSRQ